jgi:hypothetical protein
MTSRERVERRLAVIPAADVAGYSRLMCEDKLAGLTQAPMFSAFRPLYRPGHVVSILPEVAILPDHSVMGGRDGGPPMPDTEVALVAAPEAGAATRRLAEALADFCSARDPRIAA